MTRQTERELVALGVHPLSSGVTVTVDGVGLTVAEARPEMSLFTYGILIIGGFFCLNLFVAITIDKFFRLRQEYDGSAFQTQAQSEWSEKRRLLGILRPRLPAEEPDNCIRRVCHRVVTHSSFDSAIVICILLNTLTMACQHRGQSAQ